MSDLSQQPYLLRAMHEWMTACGHTPHIVVNATAPGIEVPGQYIQDGRIVLNVSYSAAHNLDLGNDQVSFEARFSGQPMQVRVPTTQILGIYARETGQGMVFSDPDSGDPRIPITESTTPSTESDPPAKPDGQNRPNLRLIK